MKKLFLFTFLIFLFSCSSPSADQDKVDTHSDTLPTNTNASTQNITPDSLPYPSEELKKFVSAAKKIHYTPAYGSDTFLTSEHKKYFGLVNVPRTFAAYEDGVMKKAKNACVKLTFVNKKAEVSEVGVEEWIFASEKEAKEIEDALSRPLADKREERFVRTPFTFWRIGVRMYYVHAGDEKLRTEMDKVNNLLVECLTPPDKY